MEVAEWDASQRERLRRARRQKGHSQDQCAEALMELGAAEAAQSTVSNWESGKTRRPPDLTIGAIAIYCSDLSDPDFPSGETSEISTSAEGTETAAAKDAEGSFERAVAEMTGARPLNDRQGRLIDELTARLGGGPPMTEADGAVARALLKALALDP